MTDDLISKQAAIDTVMEFMPSLTTPDGCGQFDREIFKAQEMFVDIGQALNNLPPVEPRWTPVTEGLPNPNKAEDACLVYYLIQNEYGDMMVASYHSNRYGETWWEQMYTYKPVEDEVVAWMPLPKPWSNNVDRNSN